MRETKQKTGILVQSCLSFIHIILNVLVYDSYIKTTFKSNRNMNLGDTVAPVIRKK
jgi:hypothetical protein